MYEAFHGQDAVVATFNHKSNGAQQGMIDAAIKAGIKRFIPADFGSNGENKAVLDLFPPLRGKAATIEYLRSKESSTFSWTSIVTGLFVDVSVILPQGHLFCNHPPSLYTFFAQLLFGHS